MDYNEKIYTFKVHDLVRELCLKIAKKDEFLSVLETPRSINREHRVVINGKVPEVDHQTRDRLSYDFNLLRTLNEVVTASTGS